MSRISMVSLSFSFLVLAACVSSPMTGDDDGSLGGSGGGGSGGSGSGTGSGSGSGGGTALDPADCSELAANAVAAQQACGGSFPGGAQAALETMCRKGINAADMCGGNPAAGLDCFATDDSTDWVCYGGDAYPACNGDLSAALGAYCLLALGNPQCASGIKCTYDADCSGGAVCNSATEQCMNKSAYCVGLPCVYDADCPTGEKCNGTEGACVRE